ncbi:uncharacterized protein MELLADRAFT_89457 [Melampsora larici-populina 98AG31]|uniref:J domain-containing protein n=1 Tax=Melampsora larici-populina (strain 98AG31 / pathotype 3-4-7) TaxID=747676 RepID=F4RTF5_MELLP|nr:uncharacterized protein MELLADRAFT_89457 [Melampsora larici-populina 98AG31]EGG04247.1 hypothetical protein MELLADRAFT_89457 [Melampsora larici-populina 98AG31]
MVISTTFSVSRDRCSPTQQDNVPLLRYNDSHDPAETPSIPPADSSKPKKRQAEPNEPENPEPAAVDADPCYPSKRYKENAKQESQISPPLHFQASKAYSDGNFLLAAHRFRLLLCLYREQKSQSNPEYPDTKMIQVCLDLTRCYLHLKKEDTAHEVLEDAWRPKRLLTIDITHPLFKDLSRLYLEVKAQQPLSSHQKNTNLSVLKDEHEREAVESLKLIYNYGTQYFFEGQPRNAVGLLRYAIRRTEEKSGTDIGESLKHALVGIHLLLAEEFLCLGQLEDVHTTLKKVWSPIHYLHIDQHHQHFLWLARVHAHATKPKTSCSNNKNNRLTIKKLDLYERLGLSHMADNIEIKKAYRRCSLLFHPDKSGDTVAFQQVSVYQFFPAY